MKRPNITEDWNLGDFEESGGYDCMTAGIRIGPAELDGSTYGQKSCGNMTPEGMAKMLADARFIAASKKTAEALEAFVSHCEHGNPMQFMARLGELYKDGKSALLSAGYEF